MSAPTPDETQIRSALRVSMASIVWTVCASAGAVAAGIAGHSLVVLIFGLTGIADAAGSVALVFHFRHALKHESMSPERERLALRVVSAGLLVIGSFSVAESARRLIVGARPHDSAYGVAIGAASFVALGLLAIRKRAVARRLSSRALAADGLLSAIGAGLAIIAVVGATLSGRRNLRWVDPVSSMLLAIIAVAGGLNMFRREEGEIGPPEAH
jgi:divalent metal cation (Fe/Co/Zn/Cd) transporter